MKTKEEVKLNPKATFYAVLYQDFRRVAIECGYALAIHGSMASDMDLIAVAWTEKSESPETLVSKISDCIGETVWKENHKTNFEIRPHGRIAYTLSIMSDWYIDLSIIPPFQKDIEALKNRNRVLENLNFKYREKLGISNIQMGTDDIIETN